MKDSIHKYFKLGTIQWMSHPTESVVDSIRRFAQDDFFDALEVKAFPSAAERKAATEILSQSHLTVAYGAQPTLLGTKLNPNDLDEQNREETETELLKGIDEAAELGCKSLAFLAGHWAEETREKQLAQLAKTAGSLCAYGEQKGILIELELFDSDLDKKSLVGPAPLALKLAEEVRMKHSDFGLLVDLSHFPTMHETTQFVIQVLKPYITHLHIGNCVVQAGADYYGDTHPRFGFPGGSNDVAELVDFFEILRIEGFFNAKNPYIMSFEVKPYPGEDAEVVIANTKRVINRAWALVAD